MTLLQHHIWALSLTAVTTFGLGLLVFLAEPKRRLNQIFGLYSLAISWWACCGIWFPGSHNEAMASLWAFLIWIGVIFIAPTFVHTVFLLTDQRNRITTAVLWVGYLISFALVILHLSFGILITPPRPVAYTLFFPGLTLFGWLIPISFYVLVNIGLWNLARAYWKSTGQQRIQLRYLFWSSLAGYLGGGANWFLVFGFHVPGFNPFGNYAVSIYSIATTYAVLHHRLFDVRLVIRKSLVYSLVVTALTVGYFGLVYAVEHFFQTTFGYRSIWLSLTAFALMALAFQPLKVGIQRLADWLLFRAPHEELVKRLEKLEHEARQTEKLKAVATLAAGMAHEIKNPLASLKTFVEYLPSKGNDPVFQRKFERVATHEVGKIDRIVHRLLDFAKPHPPQLQPVRLSQVIDDTLELLSNECLQRHIAVERFYDFYDTIRADSQQLRQVFLNLLLNSVEAMNGHGGTLCIKTSMEGEQVKVTIEDAGPGILQAHLERIFEPFFTTKPTGTGLGLSIVHSIIQEHGGRITIENVNGHGARCVLTFPLLTKWSGTLIHP